MCRELKLIEMGEKKMDTNEIRNMISLATVGDGDQVLNILGKICDKLDQLERDGRRADTNALTAVAIAQGPTCNKPNHWK